MRSNGTGRSAHALGKVLRDGELHARIVGDPAPLQRTFERQGDDISVRVDGITSTPADAERPTGALSDRQREA